MPHCFKCHETDASQFYRCAKNGYQSTCKTCKRELKKVSDKVYYERNRDKLKRGMRKRYQEVKYQVRPKMNEQTRLYSKNNRQACNAKLWRYRASKLQAMPKWVDKEALKRVYMNCPKGMEVDHIIPLRGNNVCGLHVPYNLQYLTRSENARKGNRI